jgi:antitoxin component YwqK of YwqJK toxin-antitoxin module
MKIYIYILFATILLSQNEVSQFDLIKFEDKYFLPNSYKPYSGEIIDYHKNGIKEHYGEFNRGLRVGTWYEFHKNGIIKSERKFHRLNSTYTEFHLNSNMKKFGLFVNDVKDGLWVEFDEKGMETFNLHYSSGILDSVVDLNKPVQISSIIKVLEAIPDIIKTVITQKDVQANGVYRTFYSTGELYSKEIYNGGLLDSNYVSYYKNGKKYKERFLDNGVIVKQTIQYSDIGIRQSVYNEKYEDNTFIKDGEYNSYHLNGKINEFGLYIKGYRAGLWNIFDEDENKTYDKYYTYKTADESNEYIKTNIIKFNHYGDKLLEYSVYSYLLCRPAQDCFNTVYADEVMEGDFILYYDNSNIKEKGNYSNNVKNGFWIEYYINGNTKSTIDFIAGDGMYKSFYNRSDSMIVFEDGFYSNDQRNGRWIEKNKNGLLIREYFLINGRLDSNSIMKIYAASEDTTIVENNYLSSDFYADGHPDKYIKNGIYKSYYQSGSLKAEGIYKAGKEFSKWTKYHKDGKVISTVEYDDRGNGNYISYFTTGQVLTKGLYVNYLKSGKWKSYFKNRNKQSIIFYLNGEINPNKLCSYWYENGYKKIETFLIKYNDETIFDGNYIEYFNNGIIYTEGNITNNLKNGKWIEYYASRMPKSIGNYKAGEKIGEWVYYNETGDIIKTDIYE